MKQTIYEEIQRMALLSRYDNSKTLSEQTDADWVKYPCVVNYPGAEKGTLSDGSTSYKINGEVYYSNGEKMTQNEGIKVPYSCNDNFFTKGKDTKKSADTVGKTTPASVAGKTTQTIDGKVAQVSKTAPVAIPPDLKNNTGIMAFQDWLDGNAPGWAEGYKDGKLSKGVVNAGFKSGGYGKFGPRTQKFWNNPAYKDAYLKSLQTPAAAPTIAAATTEGPKGASYTDEKTGGFYKWNGTEYEFQQNYLAPSDGIVYTWDGTRYVGTE
jgi:hypothetical protein